MTLTRQLLLQAVEVAVSAAVTEATKKAVDQTKQEMEAAQAASYQVTVLQTQADSRA